ncbi:hypothetical protein ACPC54_23830 [Kitasatospora sp. NPDC094028]
MNQPLDLDAIQAQLNQPRWTPTHTVVDQLLAEARRLEAEVERLSVTRAEVRSAIALDLMELHDDPATPERYRAGLRSAARRIPIAQDGGY